MAMATETCSESNFISSVLKTHGSDSEDSYGFVLNATTLIDEQTKEIEQYQNPLLNQEGLYFSTGSELHDVGYDHACYTLKRKRFNEQSDREAECCSYQDDQGTNFTIEMCDFDLHDGLNIDMESSELALDNVDTVDIVDTVPIDAEIAPCATGMTAKIPHKREEISPRQKFRKVTSNTPNHFDGLKVDNRGKHWASKVEEGRPPEPWKDTQAWAERRKGKEAEFDALVSAGGECSGWSLPWRSRGSRSTGNTQKVLYIELMMHQARGVAALQTDGDPTASFFGITGLKVPAAGREAFDAGLIPSADAHRLAGTQVTAESRVRLKALVKIWETAGFRELAHPDGSLEYAYDAEVFAKQKRQQTGRRGRAV